MKDAILSVMMMLSAWKDDAGDTPDQRRALYEPTAHAIEVAAEETRNPLRAAAILIALFENESMGARYVLEGRCMDGPKGMQCDYSRAKRRPLARGPFQVHGWCKEAWSNPDGSYESILGGARCALRYVDHGLRRCLKTRSNAWAGAFSVYRGQPCSSGDKVGSNFKGRKYTKAMVVAQQRLVAFEVEESRAFHEYLRVNYGYEEQPRSSVDRSTEHTEGPRNPLRPM